MNNTEAKPLALNIQFRHMPKSRSIKQLVRQQVERLNRFELPGGHCEVVIDEMHHWHKGGVFKVSLHLTVPGEPMVVASAEEESGSHEFIYSAVRKVFSEAELQLKKRRWKAGRRKASKIAA